MNGGFADNESQIIMKKHFIAAAISGLAVHAYANDEMQYQLNDVVVTATRSPVPAAELASDVTVLRHSDIVKSGATSLPELLTQQPELEVVNQGGLGSQSSLFIRGSNANHTLILVDGMRLSSATVGLTSIENIPLNQIDRIEILRGPASSLYGADAIGGVVQIFTHSSQPHDGPNLALGLGSNNTQQASAGYHLSTDRARLGVNLGSQSSNGFDATKPGTYGHNPDRDGYRNRNASINLEYDLASGHSRLDRPLHRKVEPNSTATQAQTTYKYSACRPTPFSVAIDFCHWESTVRLGESRDHLENRSAASLFETVQRQLLWQSNLNLPTGNMMLGVERIEQRVASTTAFTNTRRDINAMMAGYQITGERTIFS